jgi:5-methylcytosine-specific restriction endonuclease McrA
MRQRRSLRTGGIFLRSDGFWIGTREIPTPRGDRRRQKRVASKTFCGMLYKFSALGPVGPQRPAMTRYEAMRIARDKARHTVYEWRQQVKAQNGLCYYCGQPPGDTPTHPLVLVKDHKIPVKLGGSDGIGNVVAACGPCNQEKGLMTADEYFAFRSNQ